MGSTHTYQQDPRNADIQININGELFHRDKAVISVFDSGFILGDGIWEGLRLHHGVIPFLDKHMKRLWEGAKALDLDMGLSREALQQRLYDTLESLTGSPVVALNGAVARAMAGEPSRALATLDGLASEPRLATYAPLHVARAEVLRQLGRGAARRRRPRSDLFAFHGRDECSAAAPMTRFAATSSGRSRPTTTSGSTSATSGPVTGSGWRSAGHC